MSICVKDASGPYHYDFRQHLVALAKEQDIPFKLDIYPFYGSDASAAMSAGAEVKHALLGAGIESAILMSVPILTQLSQRSVWLMLILRVHW